ncbi:hypothetical protein AMTRI_Chr12g241020 [Amborella trichopoda]
METDETSEAIPFQLQADKPIASEIKIAEWNPEKDLLVMVTEDLKIVLHRFNWQRLWTVCPGRGITSICWRPDGKVIAVGLEDGTISLHDVENGKMLRSTKSHNVAVVCLNWEEEGQSLTDEPGAIFTYEDRTLRFYPPAPRVPQIPGLGSGVAGSVEEHEDSFQELSSSSCQRFSILCSGDKDGNICFSIFGLFLIGKLSVRELSVRMFSQVNGTTYRLLNASVYKVAFSKNLHQLIVLCFGELIGNVAGQNDEPFYPEKHDAPPGLHCLLVDTSIFRNRKNELHQVAQQASNIEELIEVVRASLSVMHKQWSDAMHAFHEKFRALSSLIIDHGLNSASQEELLSLLFGARTNPAVHQFLVTSLGEVGLKRLGKVVDSAGKELHIVVREHLLPAAEMIGFRIGELKGLSRWPARFQIIGLDEKLIDRATENAGMFLVQVERLLRILSVSLYQFQNFFTWLTKSIKLLMSEPSDQLPQFNSELVIVFLRTLFNHDPLGKHLELSSEKHTIELDSDTMQRMEELSRLGGFSDTKFLQRTLAEEFDQLQVSFREATSMPFIAISQKLHCEGVMPLFHIPSFQQKYASFNSPVKMSYYLDSDRSDSASGESRNDILDYICFGIPDETSSESRSIIGVARGFSRDRKSVDINSSSVEVVLLRVEDGYQCVDLALYKDYQIVLLLNETTLDAESPGKAWLMIVETKELPFVCLSEALGNLTLWEMCQLEGSVVDLSRKHGKARCIPHLVSPPLAVSASRGVASVFTLRKRALVYILEEDEDEISDME